MGHRLLSVTQPGAGAQHSGPASAPVPRCLHHSSEAAHSWAASPGMSVAESGRDTRTVPDHAEVCPGDAEPAPAVGPDTARPSSLWIGSSTGARSLTHVQIFTISLSCAVRC